MEALARKLQKSKEVFFLAGGRGVGSSSLLTPTE